MNINNYREDNKEDIADQINGGFTIKENPRQGFISHTKDLENKIKDF